MFIAQCMLKVPDLAGEMVMVTGLLSGKNCLILKSSMMMSSRQLFGSLRVNVIVDFFPRGRVIVVGRYPPSTIIFHESRASSLAEPDPASPDFLPKKNQYIPIIKPSPPKVMMIFSINVVIYKSANKQICE